MVDSELAQVEAELYRTDPTGDRVASVLRDTLDQLYDGQRTGRWNFAQLHKTEKTHMGTLVEINLHREFGFDDGDVTDYRIADIEVDCKYSMTSVGWTLPPEVIDHLALLVTANDTHSSWRAGLIRVELPLLNLGRNRDAKATLSREGRKHITWLWTEHGRLPPNLLLQLDDDTRARIMNAKGRRGRHGQARVDELFRSVQGRIIRRAELATVAQQMDYMKRARADGGARTTLQPEGILVLGHQRNDLAVAAVLGLPLPNLGEFVAATVVETHYPAKVSVEIDGRHWRLADPGTTDEPAPTLDRSMVDAHARPSNRA